MHDPPDPPHSASHSAPHPSSSPAQSSPPPLREELRQYECGPFRFSELDYYDRHLMFDHAISMEAASQRDRFEAVALSLRDLLTQRWLLTQQTQDRENPKRVYYLSMEFLLGRSLSNNILNLGVQSFVESDLQTDARRDWHGLLETEMDAGLGNGGLGRLAACFIESMATLHIPSMGQGLRYEYGIFRQEIVGGRQVEQPDHWLARPDPWEVARPRETVEVPIGCFFYLENGVLRASSERTMKLIGVPYDRPVVGHGGNTINTLRLWKAESPDYFDFGEFSSGDFVGAIMDRLMAETITRVLYPDDSTQVGRVLRFAQQYFLVCCSLGDIIGRFRRENADWALLPEKVAIQLNDTHPAMAVAELMRILLDQARLPWDVAWDLTIRTLAYTNHTLLPEALEKWPVGFFELLCPRLLEIVYEINRRFLDEVRVRYPEDGRRVQRMSLVEEGTTRTVRMAHLAIVGSHSTNGVAAIHSQLVRTRLVPDFAEMYPERFRNITNGVTPRRWVALANPDLAGLLTEAIGDGWLTETGRLEQLRPLADDPVFRERFRRAKRGAKLRLVDWLRKSSGLAVDPDTIFDCHIKRIHEYKRQLLNALHIVVLYNRLRKDPGLDLPPRTFFFAGKAAPAYHLAKLVIFFIHRVAAAIEADTIISRKLRVLFLPNYNVSLAERLIPAADISEQLSTAGYEASGTSNMKFMMNGALTVATRDGATIEMYQRAGEENFFLFGLDAEQVATTRPWYLARWHYENDAEVRETLDLIRDNHFCPDQPGAFQPLVDQLLERNDYYLHLADLQSYAAAQHRAGQRFRDADDWSRLAVLNVAASGHFSSDRTIREYAEQVWRAEGCRIP